jgi:hypothetical protein
MLLEPPRGLGGAFATRSTCTWRCRPPGHLSGVLGCELLYCNSCCRCCWSHREASVAHSPRGQRAPGEVNAHLWCGGPPGHLSDVSGCAFTVLQLVLPMLLEPPRGLGGASATGSTCTWRGQRAPLVRGASRSSLRCSGLRIYCTATRPSHARGRDRRRVYPSPIPRSVRPARVRTPCAARAPRVPCTSRRSRPKS